MSTPMIVHDQVYQVIIQLSKISTFQNKWLSDVVVADLIHHYCDSISTIIKSSKNKFIFRLLNKYLARNKYQFMYDLQTTNDNGIFRQRFRPRSSTRQIYCYFFCSSNKETPCESKHWYNTVIHKSSTLISNVKFTRSNTSNINLHITNSLPDTSLQQEAHEEHNTITTSNDSDVNNNETNREEYVNIDIQGTILRNQSKWYSPEVRKFFTPINSDHDNFQNEDQEIIIKLSL
jgi:hypothetical protein